LGRIYITTVQSAVQEVLQNYVLKCMTFTYRRSSWNILFKIFKILKKSALYQFHLWKFMSSDNFSETAQHSRLWRRATSIKNFCHKRIKTSYGKKCCNV